MSFVQLNKRSASWGGTLGNAMNVVKKIISNEEGLKLCSPLRKGGRRQFLIDLCCDGESNECIFGGGDGVSVWVGSSCLICRGRHF